MKRPAIALVSLGSIGAVVIGVAWLGLPGRHLPEPEDRARPLGNTGTGPVDSVRTEAGVGLAVSRMPPPNAYTSHPILPDSPPAAHPPDCSKAAIAQITATTRALEKGTRSAVMTQSRKGDAKQTCLADPTSAPRKALQDSLLDRVSGCVGQDGPLDDSWNLVNSALLAIGSCMECTDSPSMRLSKCKHARDLLAAAEKATR